MVGASFSQDPGTDGNDCGGCPPFPFKRNPAGHTTGDGQGGGGGERPWRLALGLVKIWDVHPPTPRKQSRQADSTLRWAGRGKGESARSLSPRSAEIWGPVFPSSLHQQPFLPPLDPGGNRSVVQKGSCQKVITGGCGSATSGAEIGRKKELRRSRLGGMVRVNGTSGRGGTAANTGLPAPVALLLPPNPCPVMPFACANVLPVLRVRQPGDVSRNP